ncbi:MAG: zinc-finger domain-containing protein [Burkholderiaceae bacterium]|nr:zinc-finger domain-containing protein [Burkholderiaceae bacterium]
MSVPGATADLQQAQDAVVEIDASDLPAFCPNAKMPLWSSHPRVYLELNATGKAMCSYCGTRYRLAPGSAPSGH